MASYYLSASWARRAELQEYARILEEKGHYVSSSWLKPGDYDDRDDGKSYTDISEDTLTKLSTINFADIDDCDTFVAFLEPKGSSNTRGGRHVEYGYALGSWFTPFGPEEFIVIGQPENMFYVDAWRRLAYHTPDEWLRDVTDVAPQD